MSVDSITVIFVSTSVLGKPSHVTLRSSVSTRGDKAPESWTDLLKDTLQ